MRSSIRRFSSLQAELLDRYEEGSTPAGVIYVHRISDNRFSGITGRNFGMFCTLCGESTFKNVVIVTNMWKEESWNVNESREKELSSEFFKTALDKGAQMVRHHNTAQSAHNIIRQVMKNNPVALQIQRELVDEHKDLIDTTAGGATKKELRDLIRGQQADMREIQAEMMQALRAKDKETRRELEIVRRELQENVMNVEKDLKRVAMNYAREKERAEAKMKEMD